jgi:hypothetical protein
MYVATEVGVIIRLIVGTWGGADPSLGSLDTYAIIVVSYVLQYG